MVALVTGGGGFIGGHVVARLEADSHRVVSAGRPEMDIPSPQFDELVARTAPELVVHCAAPASVPGSIADPEGDRYGSVTVLEGVLGLLSELPRTRLVLVGSAAVYGQPEALPVGEDHRLDPISPYGRHRAETEELLRRSEVPSVSLRVFSAYGEGLRRQVLWDICEKALAGGVVELGGTGRETRDFVHVRDVAAAVATVAALAPFGGETYNVGTGEETPIGELARMLISALGVDAPLRFSGRKRPGDPDRWRADATRLRELGWSPQVPMEQGAAGYARWARTELARASASEAATPSRSDARPSRGVRRR